MGAFHSPHVFLFFHSLAEMMGGSKIYGHMTIKKCTVAKIKWVGQFTHWHILPHSSLHFNIH